MAILTQDQLAFLTHHGVTLAEALDATGMKRAVYRPLMKARGLRVAYGVTMCPRRHTLRDRYGHCIQCNPASLAFAARKSLSGFVYIAVSEETGMYKVGFSRENPSNRIYIANLEGYGDASDWELRLIAWSKKGGAVESSLHYILDSYREERYWYRNGECVVAREILRCDFDMIVTILAFLLSDEERGQIQLI